MRGARAFFCQALCWRRTLCVADSGRHEHFRLIVTRSIGSCTVGRCKLRGSMFVRDISFKVVFLTGLWLFLSAVFFRGYFYLFLSLSFIGSHVLCYFNQQYCIHPMFWLLTTACIHEVFLSALFWVWFISKSPRYSFISFICRRVAMCVSRVCFVSKVDICFCCSTEMLFGLACMCFLVVII